MKALIVDDERGLLPEGCLSLLENAAQAALACEGVTGVSAGLRVVTDEEIQTLNRTMRGVDSATDVLSFPSVNYPKGVTLGRKPALVKKCYDPEIGAYYLGDVALNIGRVLEQATQYGHGADREAAYLTVHAMLHLCGYDHMNEEDKAVMRAMEKKVMRALGLFKNGERFMDTKDCIAAAIGALDLSYSPYSNFRVGACLVSEDGQCFVGANFENASYGATICAERCAVSNAIVHGVKRFTKVFIACDRGYAWPCGICRQVLNEFKACDMEVWVGNKTDEWKMMKLSSLLPESFGPEELGE